MTRWYRPPELLIGEQRYSTPVDLWGIGYVSAFHATCAALTARRCVIAEMYKKTPIFPGTSDLDQARKIFA